MTPRAGRRLVVAAILIAGVIGAIISAFSGEAGRRAVFDTWQVAAPREITSDNVVVVLVDDSSVREVGEWPWLRYQMAQLIERIALAEPAAIGIDVYFTQPDPTRPEAFASAYLPEEMDAETRARVLTLPNWDEALRAAVQRNPTVLARVALAGQVGDGEQSRFTPAEELFYPTVEGTPPPATPEFPLFLTSFDELDIEAASQGVVNGPPDSDGIVRRVPLSVMAGEVAAPGFAVELARIRQGADAIRWDGQKVIVGDTSIPSDERGNLRFKMGDYPEEELVIPAYSIFEGSFAPEELARKVVIIGVGATGTGDVVATPLASEVLGPLVQAQAVDAILEGEWLSRPAWAQSLEIIAALVLFGLLLAAGYTFWNWWLIPAGGLALALPIASFLAFDQANLLIDPARPLLIGFCAGIGLLLSRYVLALMELVEQRIRAAEQAKENENARKIQMSMVPSAATLARLDERAEIGAVLEPAKSVGGDFFDALKISEDQLLFLIGDVSGKGMPAALFMALSKMLSKSNLARAGDGFQDAVAALNRDLMEQADEEMGLTMLIGLLDCSTGALQLVNAGHENPMLVRKNGSVVTLGMVGGPPFCVTEWNYPVEDFQLAPGETLVVITDGATEATNEKDTLFGNEGVIASLKAKAGESAMNSASYLAEQVRRFEGSSDPTDDLTIFAIRNVGSAT